MKNIKVYIFIISLSLLAMGCHLFESTKVSSKEIKAASTWSKKDQGPTFSECESIESTDDKKDCFESIVSNSILDYIDQNPLESSEPISEEISAVLIIDKEGYFSLDEIERSRKMDNAIPNLEEQLLCCHQYDTSSRACHKNKCWSFCFYKNGITNYDCCRLTTL